MALIRNLTLSLVLCGLFVSQSVSAQSDDEFGEFDEDFEERQRETERQRSRPAQPAPTERGADAGDGTDEFGMVDRAPGDPEEVGLVDRANGDPDLPPDTTAPRTAANPRRQRFALHNSRLGAAGGIHIVDTGSGPSETFRLQLLTDFFFQNEFLVAGDRNAHIGGALSLSWTPFEFLEIYGSILTYANSNDQESPQLFQTLGDSVIGLKGFYSVLPWLYVGGDFAVHMLNTVGDIGLVGDSTSFSLRVGTSADFRMLDNNPIPLIARLNLQYYFDNSAALIGSTEAARYAALPTGGPNARRSPIENEDRHLITRIERFALGINRMDMFNIGLGFEAPIEVNSEWTLSPIVEWQIGIPVNRNDYSCLITAPSVTNPDPDGCLERVGASAFPSTLTVAARVLPPLRGLAFTAGVDVGVLGTYDFVRELAGTAPYSVLLGVSYAYDTRPPEPVIREVAAATPPPVEVIEGHVQGTVVEAGAGTPVVGALVSFPGRELSQQATSSEGRFTSYEFEPGEVTFEVSHPEYRSRSCSGTIGAEGGDVEVRCELEALPRFGQVEGTVVGDNGQPVPNASIQLSGTSTATVATDASGVFRRQDLPPGSYSARIDAEGFLLGSGDFQIVVRETARPRITIIARPARSLVTLRDREIVIRRQINFATDSAEILPESTALMSELADVLLRHPEITRVEIQGHTDNRGGREHNQDLSQRRADSVRQWLSGAGVDAGRLEARGFGDSRPMVPNITAGNRARNRRVQFMITDRQQ